MLKIKVFGCKTNRYYTDEWLKTEYLQGKSGIFIASCVVTDQAKNKWVRFLLKSSKELGVGEKIFISGCGVLRNGKIDDRFFEVYPELLSLQ
jgi:tRNA A37 methylthiotransferase MiaB